MVETVGTVGTEFTVEKKSQTEHKLPIKLGESNEIIVVNDNEEENWNRDMPLMPSRMSVMWNSTRTFNARLLILLGLFLVIAAKLYADWQARKHRELKGSMYSGIMGSLHKLKSKFF